MIQVLSFNGHHRALVSLKTYFMRRQRSQECKIDRATMAEDTPASGPIHDDKPSDQYLGYSVRNVLILRRLRREKDQILPLNDVYCMSHCARLGS